MDTAGPDPPQPAQPTFGALLRRYRLAAGLSQEMLAERAGLSVQGLSALENGKRRAPYRHTVTLLAAALGLTAPDAALLEATVVRGRLPAGAGASGSPLPSASQMHTTTLLPAQDGRFLPLLQWAQGPVPLPLVGRNRELTLLERHLAGEGPPVLLLAGEPGIGKSRLLAEAAARAAGRGWQVLVGGCQRSAYQEPFAPLLQALEGDLQARPRTQAAASLRGCAWLVRLLPELAGGAIEALPDGALPPEQERRLLFRAVRRSVLPYQLRPRLAYRRHRDSR